MEIKRSYGIMSDMIGNEVELSETEYMSLLCRLDDEKYVPTEEELTTNYQHGNYLFFVVRRNNFNHIVYYDNYE